MEAISLAKKLDEVGKPWVPKVVGELNGHR